MAVPKFIRPCWLNLAALECPSISAVALAVVIGSVRSNRFADHAAGWIVAALSLMTFLSNRTAGVRPEPRYYRQRSADGVRQQESTTDMASYAASRRRGRGLRGSKYINGMARPFVGRVILRRSAESKINQWPMPPIAPEMSP